MAPITGKLTLIGSTRSSLVGREGVEDVGVVRPRPRRRTRSHPCKGWEKIHRALILRTGRAGEDLVSVKVKAGRPNLRRSRLDVDATRRATRKVFRYAVRSHKDLVEVAAARAALRSALICPATLALLVAGMPPAVGKVWGSIASPNPARYVLPPSLESCRSMLKVAASW